MTFNCHKGVGFHTPLHKVESISLVATKSAKLSHRMYVKKVYGGQREEDGVKTHIDGASMLA